MNLELMIIDNFYNNPDGVRSYALSQQFNITGNFPGARTSPYLPDDVKAAIQQCVKNLAGNITNWFDSPNDQGYSGAFQLTTAIDRTWIHADYNTMWAGVCYLTPDAPHSSGTGLYRHKATGEYRRSNTDHDGYDYTTWDLVDVVGNKYNRLVLYRGDLFHASIDYFGNNAQNGRLFQTFFFNTEF